MVIGVRLNNEVNFMPCVWNTGLSYDPFLYGVSVGEKRHTNKMLRSVKSYSINFLGYEHIKLIRSMGRSSGKELNKAKKFKINYYEANKVDAPIISDSYLSMECEKVDAKLFGDHILYIGEVKLMHLLSTIKDEALLNIGVVNPTLYLGVDHYITIDRNKLVSMKDHPFHYISKSKQKS